MKTASINTFSLVLPTKGSFEIRLNKPSYAFLLATALLHILSLTAQPHEHQWIFSKLSEVDKLVKKWLWNEPIQKDRQRIQLAKIQATFTILQQVTSAKHNPDAILRSLLKWTQQELTDSELQPVQEKLKIILAFLELVKQSGGSKGIVITSGVAETLRKLRMADQARLLMTFRNAMPDLEERVHTSASSNTASDETPPEKRRNLENSTVTVDSLFEKILSAVNVERRASQDHMPQLNSIISDTWQSLDDSQKSKLVEGVGRLGCSAAGKLKLTTDKPSRTNEFKCAMCDGVDQSSPSSDLISFFLIEPLKLIFEKKPSPALVVTMVRAYARILMHDMRADTLRLHISSFGQQILTLLSSEHRSQRIAVVQILPLFVRDRAEDLRDVIRENREIIFRQLRNLQISSSREKPLLETTVMAYAEIGKVATQTDLNLVLDHLVDFLGHNNSYIAALAYREILAVASAHNQSTWQMFAPFWSTISVKIVEQMRSRPQILARIAEILDIRDSAFLTRTQNFTVPFLVAGGHRDILLQMAQKMGVQVWEMLKVNMPYVLAGLFTQEKGRTEYGIQFMVSLMAGNKSVEAGKPLIDTRSLIFSSRTPLTIELLKMLATESDAKRERVFMALQTVAAYVSDKAIGDARGTKGQELLKLYLQSNVLELMNHFTDIITDKKGRKTFTEKIGCIAGIQEIIRFAAVASKAALPQVSFSRFAAHVDNCVFSNGAHG